MARFDPTDIPEETIRMRSYLIWKRAGCPQGNEAEHWRRAREEIEAEMRCAQALDKPAAYVMPRVPVSSPPCKSISVRISHRTSPPNAARK